MRKLLVLAVLFTGCSGGGGSAPGASVSLPVTVAGYPAAISFTLMVPSGITPLAGDENGDAVISQVTVDGRPVAAVLGRALKNEASGKLAAQVVLPAGGDNLQHQVAIAVPLRPGEASGAIAVAACEARNESGAVVPSSAGSPATSGITWVTP